MHSKCQVSAAARALFSFNAHCSTVFFLSDKKDVHLMGQHCPPLKFKQVQSFRELRLIFWNMFLNTSMLVFHVCFWPLPPSSPFQPHSQGILCNSNALDFGVGGWCLGWKLVGALTILTEVFHVFPQSCHACDGIVPQVVTASFQIVSFYSPVLPSVIYTIWRNKCGANIMCDTSSLICLLWNPKF